MNELDARTLFVVVAFLAFAVITATAVLEKLSVLRDDAPEWDREHGEMCDCGVRGARPYHKHPARPWVDRAPR